MDGINLLPWRIKQKEEKQRNFFLLLGIAIISGLSIIILLHLLIAEKIKQQIEINYYLQSEVNTLDVQLAQIKDLKTRKAEMIQRLNLIYKLQVDRLLIVHAFNGLAKVIPPGLYIKNIKKDGDTLTLMGNADTMGHVSELMQNIESSKWFADPVVQEIKTNDTSKEFPHVFISHFTLTTTKLQMKKVR